MNIVVTLAERDYLFGASALYNSLVVNGFDGIFVIGYRGLESLPYLPLQSLIEHPDKVKLIELNTPIHFTNYKPAFMSIVLRDNPDCDSITYVDPDILINGPIDWILSWCTGGPAVCADVNWWMPPSHPTRRQWVYSTGIDVVHDLHLYFNGGFLSILNSDRSFLDLWQQFIDNPDCELPLDVKGEIHQWRREGRASPFMTPDQDALNIALMAWPGSITTLGPDAMGFAGGSLIPHAVGTPKPWQKHFLSHALQGKPPREVDKLYWKYANIVVQSHSSLLIFLKGFSLKCASILGRIYRKS